jgi:hypothetical protein
MIIRWGLSEKPHLDHESVYIAARYVSILSDLRIKKIPGHLTKRMHAQIEADMRIIKFAGKKYRTQAYLDGVVEIRKYGFDHRTVWRVEVGRRVETLVFHKISNERFSR